MAGRTRAGSSSNWIGASHRGIDASMRSSSVTHTRITSPGWRCSSSDTASHGSSNPGCAVRDPATAPGCANSPDREHRSGSGSPREIDSPLTRSTCASCGRSAARCRRPRRTAAPASTTSRSSCSARSGSGDSCSWATSKKASTRHCSRTACPTWICSRSPTTAAGRPPHRRSWMPRDRGWQSHPPVPGTRMDTRSRRHWIDSRHTARGCSGRTGMARWSPGSRPPGCRPKPRAGAQPRPRNSHPRPRVDRSAHGQPVCALPSYQPRHSCVRSRSRPSCRSVRRHRHRRPGPVHRLTSLRARPSIPP